MFRRGSCIVFFLFLEILPAGLVSAETGLPARTQALFDRYEQECLHNGWKKVLVGVEGRDRRLLWRGPEGPWLRGAIVALHGGGGTFSNFGSGIRLIGPMVEFGQMAIEAGFAVFSLDSGWNLAVDAQGRPYGKRWDCIAQTYRRNVDLPFIEAVLKTTIPRLRPKGSRACVFMTGISNGGFMTILAAAYFPDMMTAFAPVSAGDPFGTYIDLGTEPRLKRPTAPGVFRDNETGKLTVERGGAEAADYPHEVPWPSVKAATRPKFKQFHHEGDLLVDMSFMRKAEKQLEKHGFQNAGPFIIRETGRRTLFKHFWSSQYNRPLIEFFSSQVPIK